MAKAVKRPIIQSDSEDSDFDAQDQGTSFLQSAAKRPKSSTQSSGSGSSSESDSDDEWTVGGKSQPGGGGGGGGAGGAGGGKKMATSGPKKGQSRGKTMVQRKTLTKEPLPSSSDSSDDEDSEDNDEDEGEESKGAGDSSSEGSSSDSDSSSEQFDDGLDEDLLGDEEDQKKLNEMTETEREAEMYKRFEKREALKARFEIEQKLRRQKKKKQKEAKQKRSMRHKRSKQQDKSKSQAMDEYKAKRSADKIRKAEAEKEKKEPLKASDVFSSESEEEGSSSEESDSTQGDSDDEGVGKSLSGLRDSTPQYISTGHELGKIRLSRYRLEKWVHMPFFVDAIIGCFVRIGIGAHEGRMVYRICEIIGVQETPKVYALGSTKTNKGLKLRHGIQERTFRMEYVSNSQFTDIEFHKWKVEMEKRGLKLPTLDFIRRKAKKLDEVKNTSLKEEDVDKIIKEKQRFKKNPSNYAMTKSRMMREKETAEEAGDAEKARNLGDKLNELEERADLLDKQRTKGLSAISYINERNRQRNVTRAEMALKAEMAEGEGKADDPFTRRKCQPTLVTLAVQRDSATAELIQQLTTQTKTDDTQSTKSPDLTAAAPNGQDRLSSSMNLDELTATPAPPKSADQLDDLFSAHNFDIQIDLPSGGDESSTPKVLPRSGSTVKQDGPKRSLNLSDYKKRRGLI